MSNIAYHALVLKDNKELKALLKNDSTALSWGVIAHHVTVGLGPIKNHLISFLGKDFKITVTDIGTIENKVIAVRVKVPEFEKIHSFNKTPHITLAVNRKMGAKPFQSNQITKWTPLKTPIHLIGTLYNLDSQSNIMK